VTLAAATGDVAGFLLELGALLAGLALLARLAGAVRLSTVPLYLLAGLAFGEGGLLPLGLSESFVDAGADIGVLLLLFTLGLEFSAADLRATLRGSGTASLVDGVNVLPGLAAGVVLGWPWQAAVLLGLATYVSSSGIVAKLLEDLDRVGNRETPVVLGVLVAEDLAMAGLLPVAAVIASGDPLGQALLAGAAAITVAALAVVAAIRFGAPLSRLLAHTSDEAVLLSVLALVLVVGGLAEQANISAAVGAFLVGTALSDPIAERARQLIRPLRDLFAATFFVFFGLAIDPGTLVDVALVAALLWLAGAMTKIATGWWAARRAGIGRRGAARAGSALVARGEFSILLAQLGVTAGLEPQLGPLAAAFVLLSAVTAPLLARVADPVVDRLTGALPAARRRPTSPA
jgi:CPA2 family monovalent cation:H+ antiporter-2